MEPEMTVGDLNVSFAQTVRNHSFTHFTHFTHQQDDDNDNEHVDVLSDDVMPYIYTINLAVVCGLLSIFGITTNAINMAVFLRQGFKEAITISLFALAISDLCSLVALLFVSACYNPLFMYSGLPIITTELQHYVGAWTHILFTRITGLITVFITLERCLCIAFPLKVKNMLSPKRVKVILVIIYVIVLSSFVPQYFGFNLGWKYVPHLNKSMIGNVYNEHSSFIIMFSHAIQPIYPVFSFTMVVVCSYILIAKLNQRSQWRNTTAGAAGTNDHKSTIRDRNVVKMVVYVAIIFIISFTPSLALFIIMVIVPEFNMGYKYQNSFILTYSISFAFEGFNSGVNILIYYKTSSNYKQHFKALFSKRQNPT